MPYFAVPRFARKASAPSPLAAALAAALDRRTLADIGIDPAGVESMAHDLAPARVSARRRGERR